MMKNTEWILKLLDEIDKRHERRFLSMERAVDLARGDAQRAIDKASEANQREFKGVNELRGMAEDFQANSMPKGEANLRFESIEKRLSVYESKLLRGEGRKEGIQGGWGWAVAAVMFVIALWSTLQALGS